MSEKPQVYADDSGLMVHGGDPECPHVWIDWVGGDVLIPVCLECAAVRVVDYVTGEPIPLAPPPA